ncbi:MAG TPA: MFS transporter, partial [Acidimicrobiales bacterium]|nr:MFS transporter [Acidimicrobiales bacterium]
MAEQRRGFSFGKLLRDTGKQAKFLSNEVRHYSDLRQTPYGLQPVFVITVVSFFLTFESQALGVALPDIGQDLHISVSGLIGLSAFVSGVGIFVGIGFAYYFDRYKRAPWIGLATIVSGFAGMWSSQAHTFAGLGALRTLDDGATLALDTPFFSLLSDYYPPESRGRVYALRSLAGPIIVAVAAVIIGP